MVVRLWHGWALPHNADAYEHVLTSQVIPGIVAKAIPGFIGMEAFRQLESTVEGLVEFVTVMRFESEESIRAFVGDDIGASYVPAAAREVLERFDERSIHLAPVYSSLDVKVRA